MLNRILDKFTYVKDLKMRIRQLEAIGHTLMTQKSEAVSEKKRALLKLKYLESVVIDVIECFPVVFEDEQGRFISVDAADLAANKNKYVKCVHTFPEDEIIVRVKEGKEE